jgi:hypothetical protein
LQNLLRSKLLRKDTKCKIYKTLIKPVVLYGSKSWTLTKVSEDKLKIFEINILRKIYGPSYVSGVWTIKYNDELYKLFKEPNIVQTIKINRLKWLGHIRRMEESSLCKKLTFSHLEGCRKKGRPKLRWLGDVLQDLKTLKVTVWWKKAQDRDRWKAVIKEAKAHKGL